MKKFIYTIVFTAITAISISACTEQNVKPKDGPGSASDCGYQGSTGCK